MLELDFTQTLGSHCLQIRETLPASGITAVFGVSGAGKTSLINAISGLTRPGGADRTQWPGAERHRAAYLLAPEQRRIGYVFQDARLFPHYKVRGNLRMGWRNPWSASSISWWICWGLRPCWIVCRAGYPAAKSSEWLSAAPC